MDLQDLDRTEQLALVALIEFVGAAEPETSEEEEAEISRVIEAVGEGTWDELVAEVDARFHDLDRLKVFLETILRPEARALIFEAVLEAGLADGRALRNAGILDWLSAAWGVEIEIPTEDED